MLDKLFQLKDDLYDQKIDQRIDRVFEELKNQYPTGEDAWGLNLKKAKTILKKSYPLYTKYFDVRVFHREPSAISDGRPLVIVSNHSGQIAIDAMLVSMAFVLDVHPPRILRQMVERFFTKIPFVNIWASEGGAVLGDRKNCQKLLERGESVMAFPEGVPGVAKSTKDYYQLQYFTQGFIRMALKSKVDILPVAVVGAEQIFPWVYQAKDIAKFFGIPALPLSPLYFPLPSPVDIYIGNPITLPSDLSSDAGDDEIDEHVVMIKNIIKEMIDEGLEQRRKVFGLSEDLAKKFGL
jgi:1-acyl-sn-glycerol-3-phosphate acyltransferase